MFGLLVLAGAPVAIDFDLAQLPAPANECRKSSGDQIIVCAPRIVRDNRIKDLGSADEAYLPKAEVKLIGDVKAAVENESANVGGFPSRRMMVRIKMPF